MLGLIKSRILLINHFIRALHLTVTPIDPSHFAKFSAFVARNAKKHVPTDGIDHLGGGDIDGNVAQVAQLITNHRMITERLTTRQRVHIVLPIEPALCLVWVELDKTN